MRTYFYVQLKILRGLDAETLRVMEEGFHQWLDAEAPLEEGDEDLPVSRCAVCGMPHMVGASCLCEKHDT